MGAVYKDGEICHVLTKEATLIKKMRGSKYVQSNMRSVFSEIKDKLQNSEEVIFCGTSCQVHALYAYLHTLNIDTQKLITLDLICHGVPSPGIYRDYIDFFQKKRNRTVISHSFRSKKFGWGIELGDVNYLQEFTIQNNKVVSDFYVNIWKSIFFSNLCIRESCYSCPYTTVNKPSDITMGDFWHCRSILPENCANANGLSLAIAHTEKGKHILERIQAIHIDESYCQSIVNSQPQLRRPILEPKNREQFWIDYHTHSFIELAKKYFRYTVKNRMLFGVWKVFIHLHFYKIANKISKRIFI